MIQDAFATNKRSALAKKISLEGPLLDRPEEAVFFSQIEGDSRRYLQVLVNFVNNAIKFT